MDDETDEIHGRFAAQSGAPVGTDVRIWQAGFEYRGSVVIPKLGEGDDARHMFRRHQAEVAEANAPPVSKK